MSSVHCLQTNLDAEPVRSEPVWTPQQGTGRDLRNAFGRFATGVTVMTVDSPDGPFGMTVNSFSSVSLDPALILWSVDSNSARSPLFREAEHFAVNILSDQQTAIALAFARDPFAFDGISWQRGEQGLPVLDHCVATLCCRMETVHAGGDHHIIIGQVLQACVADRKPLVFHEGDFGALA